MNKSKSQKPIFERLDSSKKSENRVFLVMALLVGIILSLNWVAYHSADVVLSPQELASENQNNPTVSGMDSPGFDGINQ